MNTNASAAEHAVARASTALAAFHDAANKAADKAVQDRSASVIRNGLVYHKASNVVASKGSFFPAACKDTTRVVGPKIHFKPQTAKKEGIHPYRRFCPSTGTRTKALIPRWEQLEVRNALRELSCRGVFNVASNRAAGGAVCGSGWMTAAKAAPTKAVGYQSQGRIKFHTT